MEITCGDFTCIFIVKADLLAKYGGVAPKMAEAAHAEVIDQVMDLSYLSLHFYLKKFYVCSVDADWVLSGLTACLVYVDISKIECSYT